MAKKVLLVRPSYDPRIVNLEDITGQLPFLKKKAFMVPLDLATVAAVTPDDVELDMWTARSGRIRPNRLGRTTTWWVFRVRRALRLYQAAGLPRGAGCRVVGGPCVSPAPIAPLPLDTCFIARPSTPGRLPAGWRAGGHGPSTARDQGAWRSPLRALGT